MCVVPNSEKKYCPVKTLSDFISKTDPNTSSLFNCCSKPVLTSQNDERIWYTDVPIEHYQFNRFVLGTDLKKLGRWTRELQFCSYRSNNPFCFILQEPHHACMLNLCLFKCYNILIFLPTPPSFFVLALLLMLLRNFDKLAQDTLFLFELEQNFFFFPMKFLSLFND